MSNAFRYIPFYPLCMLIKLMFSYGVSIKRWHIVLVYIGRYIILEPFRLLEIIFFERRINNHELKADPIFVLGHWRSGTTLMQHILMCDSQHTSSTVFTCILSDVFLLTEPWLKPIIRFFSKIFGAQYSIQKTKMDLDLPAELETAMVSSMSSYSYTWGHLFPTHFTSFLKDFTYENQEAFLQDYHFLIKKISFASNGKRVIVKSPGDTGRLNALLKQYPQAKFVYLHRELHDLYHSNIYLWQTILRENA